MSSPPNPITISVRPIFPQEATSIPAKGSDIHTAIAVNKTRLDRASFRVGGGCGIGTGHGGEKSKPETP
jgi:hypothetical protein